MVWLAGELANALNLVSWSASTDDSRYVLKSALIESHAKKLTVVATNGREMAFVETALIGSKFSIIVPADFSKQFVQRTFEKKAQRFHQTKIKSKSAMIREITFANSLKGIIRTGGKSFQAKASRLARSK